MAVPQYGPAKPKVPQYQPAPPGYVSPYADSSATSATSTDPYLVSGYEQPPEFSYDPALEAERRAAQRGLEDTITDIGTARKQATQDFKTSVGDTKLTKKRGLSDIRRSVHRGNQDIGLRRRDVNQDAERARQDFGTRLANIIENNRRAGNVDRQQLNVSGESEGGAVYASNLRRAQGLARDAAPIATGLQRVGEDQTEAQRKLDISQGRLTQDASQNKQRLKQDARHDIFLDKRGQKRTKQDLRRQLQRAIREGTFADIDLIKQEIFQAQQLKPGSFKHLADQAANAAEDAKPDKGGKNGNNGGKKPKKKGGKK